MIGEIILVNDIQEEVEHFASALNPSDVRIYEESEIQIKHIHDIIAEAHIATDSLKTLIIAAHSFRTEAQNALLKTLEEPPENVKFILISRNKTALIPTIRSRCLLTDKRVRESITPFTLTLSTLSLESIYTYITTLAKDNEDSKIHGRQLVGSILHSVAKEGIKLGEMELAMFDSALEQLENYRPKHIVCLNLLLMIYYKTHKRVPNALR
ncbi:DNA polymerase III subunit delta' [Helicobacter canis]|uniref:DNA polymerase III subunit delta n=2 Tax=Helicobacter canis TaxID=29419 RepID=V8CHN5_9HELI|nr:DNA polymerase III subunit delta' [Helicobacter canis]ETD26515.1 hypothetical protein HMPREF2087_00897 [Helicobacter canis NCTC 12740]KAA8709551.1 hypothetical protein F4V45_04535 [Helicobacter canis]